MKYFMYVPGMVVSGNVMRNESLGGSESAGAYISRELVRKGHEVHLFSSTQNDEVWDGVHIHPIGNMTEQAPMGDKFQSLRQL